METVSDALKALKKASSHVVAARLGISREEAVNELWELKSKRTARAVLTGMCYSAGSAMRHGSSS
ncbi:hypothetical protein ACI50M_27915, partial [Escherichia coli]|uniref:hypothetical protein n=1 Tax=Escherichia coli TaxID=562 RepID=UPI0038CC1BEE